MKLEGRCYEQETRASKCAAGDLDQIGWRCIAPTS